MPSNDIEIILTMFPGPERDTLAQDLEEQNFEVALCDSGDCIFNRTAARPGPHVLLLDTLLSGPDTEEILESLAAAPRPVHTLLITDAHTANMSGVWAELGVWGYLLRPVNFGLLIMYLNRIAEAVRTRRQNTHLRAWLSRGRGMPPAGVFHSSPMKAVRAAARAAAQERDPVLVLGEPGTDMRAVAYEIHTAGPRRDNAFLAVNCAAHDPDELDAVLFGAPDEGLDKRHHASPGGFYCAHTGTLFLNEIESLPAPLQERLLEKLLQARHPDVWPDTRIVAASSANLSLEIGRNCFDPELYGMLKTTVITIPPLRERHEDIPELARRYIAAAGLAPGMRFSLSDAAFDILANYYWPGNERELKNVVQRAAARAAGPSLDAEDVLPLLGSVPADASGALPGDGLGKCVFPALDIPLKEIEKFYIARVLKYFDFHREQTARVLGVSRKTLYSKIKEFGLIDKIVREELE